MPRRPNRRKSVAALDLKKIEDLAAKGLTLEQIAAALSIDVRTLYNHRKKFREVGEAINRGAARGKGTRRGRYTNGITQNHRRLPGDG